MRTITSHIIPEIQMKFPMKVQMDVSTIRIEQTYTLQRTKKKKKEMKNNKNKILIERLSNLYLNKRTPPLGCFVKYIPKNCLRTSTTSTSRNKIPPRTIFEFISEKPKRHYCGVSPNIYRILSTNRLHEQYFESVFENDHHVEGASSNIYRILSSEHQCNIPRATTLTT